MFLFFSEHPISFYKNLQKINRNFKILSRDFDQYGFR